MGALGVSGWEVTVFGFDIRQNFSGIAVSGYFGLGWNLGFGFGVWSVFCLFGYSYSVFGCFRDLVF